MSTGVPTIRLAVALALAAVFSAAARVAAATATVAGTVSLASCPGGPPTVVVDAGHSPAEPGAISARGRPEYEFNWPLAQAVAAALARAGAWPKLINEAGAKISLGERVALINRCHPALVFSLHHDAVQPRYLESWTVGDRRLDYSDRYSGYSLFVSGRNVAAAETERLARALAEGLQAAGLAPSLHHAENIPGENRPLVDDRLGIYAYDGLAVLKGAAAPAVLIEAGIIKNRTDEEILQTPAFRKKVADAVVGAVASWCRIREGGRHPGGSR